MKTQEKTGEVTEMTNGENGNNTKSKAGEAAALTNKKNENKKYQYYSIGWHQFALVIWMVFIALLLIFGLSLFVGFVEHIYHGWTDVWASEGNPESKQGCGFNLGVLPDFLGGMVGILAGFILEWLVFEKIKNLSKYKTIISCLKIEFEKDLVVLGAKEVCKINEIVIDDIVLSAENSVIIYNLPSYFLFKRSNKGEEFLNLLQEIHGYITKRNKTIKEVVEKGRPEKDGELIKVQYGEFSKREPAAIRKDGAYFKDKTWAEYIEQKIKHFMNETMNYDRHMKIKKK